MSGKFLITGLPRSRTAWWSIAATTPVSICHHEPLKHTKCFDDLAVYWQDPWAEYIGISDSGVAPQLGRILAEIQPRTLIVKRKPKDVMSAFIAYMGEAATDRLAVWAYIEKSAAELAKCEAHELVKTVDYDALSRSETVEACFEWLMPGQAHRFRHDLLHMNVQVNKAHTMLNIIKPHNHWYRA